MELPFTIPEGTFFQEFENGNYVVVVERSRVGGESLAIARYRYIPDQLQTHVDRLYMGRSQIILDQERYLPSGKFAASTWSRIGIMYGEVFYQENMWSGYSDNYLPDRVKREELIATVQNVFQSGLTILDLGNIQYSVADDWGLNS